MRRLGLKNSASVIAVVSLALGVATPGMLAFAQQPSAQQPNTQSPTDLVPPSAAPKSLLPAGTFAPPPPPVAEPEPLEPDASLPGETPEGVDAAGVEGVPLEAGATPVLHETRTAGILSSSTPVGLAGPQSGGFDETLWAGSSGPFVRDLIRGMPAPTASRWAHVLLRKALATRTPTPDGTLPANFVAERAHLLLRMGEADVARRLAAQVPVASFTRRMFDVAPQAYLAAGDVPGLCPLVQTGITVSSDPVWPLTSAVCAALQGDDAGAILTLDRERENRSSRHFDIQLAEVVASSLGGGDRGVNAVWPQNARLTTYRLSMALAGGVEVPRPRLSSANTAVKGWISRLGNVPLAVRLDTSRTAAATGALPAQELLNLWSQQAAMVDESAIRALPVGKLRAAYMAKTAPERLQALRDLWAGVASPQDKVALYLVAADASARLPRDKALLAGAPDLGRSLLLAGNIPAARAWYDLARREAKARNPNAGKPLMQLWPLVATADAHGGVPRSVALFELWDDGQEGDRAAKARRRELVSAALTGLGILPMADMPRAARVELADTSFTRRLREASNAGRKGEVIVLAGVGLGTDATTVSPAYLHEIVGALANVGLRREAGIIASEILIRNGV